eukprot:scaffold73_cov337-Pavlova_lutheri.AAC.26
MRATGMDCHPPVLLERSFSPLPIREEFVGGRTVRPSSVPPSTPCGLELVLFTHLVELQHCIQVLLCEVSHVFDHHIAECLSFLQGDFDRRSTVGPIRPASGTLPRPMGSIHDLLPPLPRQRHGQSDRHAHEKRSPTARTRRLLSRHGFPRNYEPLNRGF